MNILSDILKSFLISFVIVIIVAAVLMIPGLFIDSLSVSFENYKIPVPTAFIVWGVVFFIVRLR